MVPSVPAPVEVVVATELTPELVAAFARLIPQLSRSAPPPTADELREMIDSPATDLLVAKDGELVTDISSPTVKRAAKAVNDQLPFPRVLHGPQDAYKGFRKGATAFEWDGTVRHFGTEEEVRAYYQSIGRETRAGSYPRPSPGTRVEDELAKRRARKAGKPTGWQ